MKRLVLVLMVLGLVFAGCAQKKAVQPEADEAEQPQALQPGAVEEKTETAKPSERLEKIKEEQIAKVETKPVEQEEEASGMFEDIHFDFDKYDIREDAKPILKALSDYLIENAHHKVLIEGHCDERGTNEYNLALGDKRAKAVKDYLLAMGIASSRIETISYGEEKPYCKEHNEKCWAQNRRAHFVIIKGKM